MVNFANFWSLFEQLTSWKMCSCTPLWIAKALGHGSQGVYQTKTCEN